MNDLMLIRLLLDPTLTMREARKMLRAIKRKRKPRPKAGR